MKKVFGVIAVSALVFAGSAAFAGSKSVKAVEGCPGDCQQQIDALQSGQARQDEQIGANSDKINKQAEQINALAKSRINPWYVKAIGKYAIIDDPSIPDAPHALNADDGYGFGLAVGRQFGQFRTDFALATQKADLEYVNSGDMRFNTAMVNGTYDFPIMDAFSFYGTVGLGAGQVDVSIYNADGSETTFAYTGGLGVSYSFADNMAVDFGYEYLGFSDVNIEGTEVEDIASNNIVAAFRYSF